MEYRRLGVSGLKVPVLSFGTATFGGTTEFFRAWGDTDIKQAKRLVDICLDSGVNRFDSADVYSNGSAVIMNGSSCRWARIRAWAQSSGVPWDGGARPAKSGAASRCTNTAVCT